MLKYGNYPYIFVVSNEKDIRDYFEIKLSEMSDLVSPLNEYDLSSTSWLNELQKNNLLLLNIIEEEQKLETKARESNSIFAGSAFYYSLVLPRELIAKTGNGLIMVCDEHIISKILNANQSVVSCSHITFFDDILKQERNNSNEEKKLTKN